MTRRTTSLLAAIAFAAACAAPGPASVPAPHVHGPDVLRIEVIVLGPDGERVPRCQISYSYYYSDGGEVSGAEVRDGRWVRTFEVRNEPVLRLDVGDARDAMGPLPFGATSYGPVDLERKVAVVRLQPERVITGTVRGADGAPLPDAVVVAIATEASLMFRASYHGPYDDETVTAADGTFRLGRLRDGTYWLFVEPVQPEWLKSERIDCRSGKSGLEIGLLAAARPVVTVLDPEGRPLAGAKVSASPFTGVHDRPDHFSEGKTAADGRVRLGNLPPDREAFLWVLPPEDRPELFAVQIHDWRPKDTTIRLEEAERSRD